MRSQLFLKLALLDILVKLRVSYPRLPFQNFSGMFQLNPVNTAANHFALPTSKVGIVATIVGIVATVCATVLFAFPVHNDFCVEG